MATLYDVLGLSRSAAVTDIRKAFKRSVLKTHPDKGGTEEAFRQVLSAFEVLVDVEQRTLYDRRLLRQAKEVHDVGCTTARSCPTSQRSKCKSRDTECMNMNRSRPAESNPATPMPKAKQRRAHAGSCSQKLPEASPATSQKAPTSSEDAARAEFPTFVREMQHIAFPRQAQREKVPPSPEHSAGLCTASCPASSKVPIDLATACPAHAKLLKLMKRLHRSLKLLPVDSRRILLSNHLTQAERMMLERWMLSKRTVSQAQSQEVGKALVSSSNGPSSGTKTGFEPDECEGDPDSGQSASDAALEVLVGQSSTNAKDPLAICDDFRHAADASTRLMSDDGKPPPKSADMLVLCSMDVAHDGAAECGLREAPRSNAVVVTRAEVSEQDPDTPKQDAEPRKRNSKPLVRGICTKGHSRGYYALVTIGMCWLRSVECRQLARVVDFHVALMDLKGRWMAAGPDASEPELLAIAFTTFQEHGIDHEQEMHLKMRIRVPVRTWILKPEQINTPEFGLLRGVKAWCQLRQVRVGFHRTGFGFSSEVCDPHTLASTWKRLLKLYFGILIQTGRDVAAMEAELNFRWDENRPQLERKAETWNQCRMCQEEKLTRAGERLEKWNRKRMEDEEHYQRQSTARVERWNRQAMAREERLQRAVLSRELRIASWERRAMHREEVLTRRLHRFAIQKDKQMQLKARVLRLLQHWRRLQTSAEGRSRRIAAKQKKARRAHQRVLRAEQRAAEIRHKAAMRIETEQLRQRRAERDAKWQRMNRKDITMAEILSREL